MGHSEDTSRENLTRLPMQSPVILYSVPAGSPGAANPTLSGSEWNDQTGPLQTGGTSQLGIAPATTRTYRTGVMCYKSFCQRLSLEVTPALEEELLLFVTELTQSRAVSTIRCYLAVVRHFHIVTSFANPLEGKLRLQSRASNASSLPPGTHHTISTAGNLRSPGSTG